MNARPQDRSEGADFAAILTPYSAQLRLINSLVRRVPDSEQVRLVFCTTLSASVKKPVSCARLHDLA